MLYISAMRSYTEAQLLNSLREAIRAKTQRQLAAELGFTPQFINDVLKGRREFTENLANALGFEKLPDRFVRQNSRSEP